MLDLNIFRLALLVALATGINATTAESQAPLSSEDLGYARCMAAANALTDSGSPIEREAAAALAGFYMGRLAQDKADIQMAAREVTRMTSSYAVDVKAAKEVADSCASKSDTVTEPFMAETRKALNKYQQDRGSTAKDSFPFGLDKIRWGMSEQQAASQYSSIAPKREPAGSPLANEPGDYLGPYVWRDCTFTVSLYFSPQGLNSISLDSKNVSKACRDSMQEELAAHYGVGKETDALVIPRADSITVNPHSKFGVSIRWDDPNTAAVYNAMDNGAFVSAVLEYTHAPRIKTFDTAPPHGH